MAEQSRESGKNDQARINYPKSQTCTTTFRNILCLYFVYLKKRGDTETDTHTHNNAMQSVIVCVQTNVIKFIRLTLISFAAYFCFGQNRFDRWLQTRLHSSHVRNSVRIFQWANYCISFRLLCDFGIAIAIAIA